MKPAYMTLIRWVMPATTPRSWVIRIIAVPDSVVSRRSISRTWAWIVTSRAVVGSSAIISFGSSARAIAIITRWRIPPENCGGSSCRRVSGFGIPTIASSSIARVRASAAVDLLVGPDRLDHLLLDGEHRVQARHRVLEDHRDVPPAELAHVVLRQGHEVEAVEQDRPPSIRPAGFGQQPHDREVRHALAAARLADEAERLARLELERDAVHGMDRALVGTKPDDQVVDVEERASASARFIRGSSDSRRPSPRRLNPIALIEIAAPVKKMIHGAWR